MDDLRKQVRQLSGKYDTLVRDVKILKSKLRKDESTITTLQREVIQLKKQRPNLSNNTQNANNLNNVNIAKDILSASAPPVTSNLNQAMAMDPLDMIFGGGGSNKATQNNGNANNTKNNQSGAGDFGSWTTF